RIEQEHHRRHHQQHQRGQQQPGFETDVGDRLRGLLVAHRFGHRSHKTLMASDAASISSTSANSLTRPRTSALMRERVASCNAEPIGTSTTARLNSSVFSTNTTTTGGLNTR